jgi:hypothetical protein
MNEGLALCSPNFHDNDPACKHTTLVRQFAWRNIGPRATDLSSYMICDSGGMVRYSTQMKVPMAAPRTGSSSVLQRCKDEC